MSLGRVIVVDMKKFVVIHRGYRSATPDRLAAWSSWSQRRAPSFADIGNAFGPGRRITNDRIIELSLSSNSASGYSIVYAEHLDAAEQLLEGCPIADSVTVYEALPSLPPAVSNQEQREEHT